MYFARTPVEDGDKQHNGAYELRFAPCHPTRRCATTAVPAIPSCRRSTSAGAFLYKSYSL